MQSNIIGVIGDTLVLYAYIMLQIGKLNQSQFRFSLLNVLGSFCILYSLYFHWNMASAIIEIFWLGISLFGCARVIYTRKNIAKR